MAAVVSSMFTPDIRAAPPAFSKASAASNVVALPSFSPAANVLITRLASEASSPNRFIAPVTTLAAPAKSVPADFEKTITSLDTACRAAWFLSSCGAALPTTVNASAISVDVETISAPPVKVIVWSASILSFSASASAPETPSVADNCANASSNSIAF